MSDFGYKPSSNVSFIIKNLSNKKIRVFNYPLWPGNTRDLMRIPAITEEDIRDSLLKGQLQFMLSVHQIAIVSSDINLTQFNPAQRQFLENLGVTTYAENDSKWSLQAAWYIDPVTGDDQNTGDTSGQAIRTIAEFMLRTAGLIGTVMTVNLVCVDSWPVGDSARFVGLNISSGCKLKIVGTATTLASGTFTGGTAINHATNSATTVSNSSLGGSGFGSGVTTDGSFQHRMRITGGARVGNLAWGCKDPGGAKTARTSAWKIFDVNTIVTPANTDPYVIEKLTILPDLIIDVVTFGENSTVANAVEIYNIALPVSIFSAPTFNYATFRANGWGAVTCYGCQLWHVLVNDGGVIFDNCQTDQSTFAGGQVHVLAGYSSSTMYCYPGSYTIVDLDHTRNYDDNIDNTGGEMVIVRGSALLSIGTAGAFDGINGGTDRGLTIEPGGVVRLQTILAGACALYGQGYSGFGVVVQSGGMLSYEVKPTLTGASNSSIGGTTTAWSSVPFINTTNHAKIVLTA